MILDHTTIGGWSFELDKYSTQALVTPGCLTLCESIEPGLE